MVNVTIYSIHGSYGFRTMRSNSHDALDGEAGQKNAGTGHCGVHTSGCLGRNEAGMAWHGYSKRPQKQSSDRKPTSNLSSDLGFSRHSFQFQHFVYFFQKFSPRFFSARSFRSCFLLVFSRDSSAWRRVKPSGCWSSKPCTKPCGLVGRLVGRLVAMWPSWGISIRPRRAARPGPNLAEILGSCADDGNWRWEFFRWDYDGINDIYIYTYIYIWATVKTPAILNMYSTDIGLWKLMEIVKNTR